MTGSQRDRQLLRQAEGYVELALASRSELPVEMRHALASRCVELLDQLTTAMARRSPAMALRGQALKLAERYDDAILVFERALEKDDENIHLYLAVAWCYKRTNQLDMAIETLDEALLVDDDEPILYYNLACYWALAGNVKSTVHFLTRALDRDLTLRDLVSKEEDFDPVRQAPDFQALMTANV